MMGSLKSTEGVQVRKLTVFVYHLVSIYTGIFILILTYSGFYEHLASFFLGQNQTHYKEDEDQVAIFNEEDLCDEEDISAEDGDDDEDDEDQKIQG